MRTPLPTRIALMALALFLLVDLTESQVAQSVASFNFFINIRTLPYATTTSGIPLYSSSNSLSLNWNWDTCAPSAGKSPNCVWLAPPGVSTVFPSGLAMLELRASFPGTDRYKVYNLLTGNDSLSILAAGSGANGTFTISNILEFPSDYYVVYMQAKDANGAIVKGQTNYFAIQNTQPLPDMNPIQIVTPQPNSIWAAESSQPYLIRWQVLGTGIYPDQISIDILDANTNSTIQTLYNRTRNYFIDSSLGFATNATFWNISSAMVGKRILVRWTGVMVSNGWSLPGVTEVMSGPLLIGPSARSSGSIPSTYLGSLIFFLLLVQWWTWL